MLVRVMAYPWFSITALTLVALLGLLAVGAGVGVWRIRSLAVELRCVLIGAILMIAAAGIGWLVFMAPVYVD